MKLRHTKSFEIKTASIPADQAIKQLGKTAFELGAAASRDHSSHVAEPAQDNLKTLVAIATNAWRAKVKMLDSHAGEVRQEMKRVYRHVEAIYRNLGELGIEIRDHTGDAYDEGQPMKVVASKPTPGLEKKRVSETLLPSIYWNNRLVQNGEIEIATPASPSASVESQPHQP